MTVYDGDQAHVTNIFISYSSIDRARVNGLGLLLEAMGHKIFHDHRTIKPGSKWRAALQEGLDEANAVMVFWTKNAKRSDWVRKEYEYFSVTYPDRVLVPVLGDETPLTELLKTRQAADFSVLPNELLEMKRKMQREKKPPKEIMAAVDRRLEQEGIRLGLKARMWFFLFLGFGWLASLLRYPGESAKTAGRAVVEKAAQASPGLFGALGGAALLGLLAGGPLDVIPVGAPRLPVKEPDLQPLQEQHRNILSKIETVGGSFPVECPAGDCPEQIDIVPINTRLDVLADCRVQIQALRDEIAELEPKVCPPPPILTRVVGDPEVATVGPVPIATPRPTYPGGDARGEVVFNTIIDEEGNVQVQDVTGPADLQAAAESALESWRFEPGMEDGRPVPWGLTVRMRFVPAEEGEGGQGLRRD